MSLLSVTVKKAQFVGGQAAVHGNSYVTLKLQHVKSTTVTVKGATPSWEQDFLFEVNNLDTGLLIEVWNKGLFWDKAAGYHWLHLRDIQHSNVEGSGQWLTLDADLVMRDGEVVGTKTATGHAILIDARFELPYANDLEGEEAVELQRKLEMLNSMLDQEARAEQARKQHQYYIQSAGVSEDSDYTSDVNYPIGQHPNSSASQFLSVANQLNTPQRSLNSSRENSYEKDDDYYRTNGPQHSPYYPPYPKHRKQLPTIPNPQQQQPRGLSSRSSSQQRFWDEPRDSETDPLYYNSRPQSNYKSYSSYRRRNSWEDEHNKKRPEDIQAQPLQYEDDDYEDAQEYSQPQHNYAKRLKNNRRGTPSLERQYTLYEDASGDYLEEEVEDADSRSRPFVNDPYATYNQQNAHKDSVYDEYNQQYSDYVQDGTAYDDRYIDYQSEVISGQDQYAKDNNYQQYDGWSNEQDSRDQYTTPSSKKHGKELPQVPSQYHRQPPSQTESPFASQTTVKEASVSASAVPSVIATHHDASVSGVTVPSTSTAAEVISSGGYGNVNADGSFYDETNYNNHAPVDHSSLVGRVDAVVPTTMASNDHSEQYMDAYENPEGYEDWQNYGYYDEAGNYVQYDPNSYYDESGNLIPAEVPSTQTHEKDTYGYYDEAAANYEGQTQAAATTVAAPISTHPLTATESYEQYEDASYFNAREVDQQYPEYEDGNDPASYSSYKQDEYWYDDKDTTAFDQKKSDPSHPELDVFNNKPKIRPHLDSQSSVEYNYAYQSAENLFDNSAQKLEKSEPISRRASFRRQASTIDYGLADGGPPGQPHLETNAYVPPTVVSVAPTTTITTSTTSSAATTAANAANKITSELKSALPGLTSFTKGKTDLFSSSFSKLGSFVSNAAAKTGVTVPLINKEKETPVVQPNVAVKTAQPIASMDQGLGHSLDESQYNQYGHWNGQYDEEITGEYHGYVEGRTDSFDQYDPAEEGKEGVISKGPVHMDSTESNVSEGIKDADQNDLEAEYWKIQRERIAKQASLTAQDSQDYYNYDPYGENKAPVIQSMDSTEDRAFGHDEFNRQESLDREEWLRELEKQSGGQIRPSLNKKDTMSISLDRSESIDRQTDYGDEYATDQEHDVVTGQDSLESGDVGYPTSPPPPILKSSEEEMLERGRRKSSIEILLSGKDNKGKTVSFEEEPPKVVPERQTKGMTAREKWVWSINRICSQLAVRHSAVCTVIITAILLIALIQSTNIPVSEQLAYIRVGLYEISQRV